ncbi:MAG: glycosyltransferase [Actinobacteria bacterium]|nr:glycosyltransferase [Actinomycetota bacterium]
MNLSHVLVVTVKKSFWASPESDVFPHRVYARVFYGHSTNLLNSTVVFVRGLVAIALRRPRVVVLGSVERTVPWFIRARRFGLLGRARLIVVNQLNLSEAQLRFVDKDIVYQRTWIERQPPATQAKAVFTYDPADGDYESVREAVTETGDYVFTGGGTGRDFPSVIEAVRGTDVPLEVVTFSPETLGWTGELPANCTVHWLMPMTEFLGRMARAKVVVVPLRDPDSDFGQMMVSQALSLGKAIVATRSPGIADYVVDGQEGLLVEAGSIPAYRDAIVRLLQDDDLRHACEGHALRRAEDLTYGVFANRLVTLCQELMS